MNECPNKCTRVIVGVKSAPQLRVWWAERDGSMSWFPAVFIRASYIDEALDGQDCSNSRHYDDSGWQVGYVDDDGELVFICDAAPGFRPLVLHEAVDPKDTARDWISEQAASWEKVAAAH